MSYDRRLIVDRSSGSLGNSGSKSNFGSGSLNINDFLNKISSFQHSRNDSLNISIKGKKSNGSSTKVQCQICEKFLHSAYNIFQLLDFKKNSGSEGLTALWLSIPTLPIIGSC